MADARSVLNQISRNLTVKRADPSIIFDSILAGDTDFWMGVQDDGGGDDDDKFQIGDGVILGTNPFLTIDTTGNIGIGMTGPTTRLHITAVSNSAGVFRLDHYGVTEARDFLYALSGGGVNYDTLYLRGENSAGSETFSDLMNWHAGGNVGIGYDAGLGTGKLIVSGSVGIGTTGPDRKLDVLDTTNPQLRLTQTDGTVYGEARVDASGNWTFTLTGTKVVANQWESTVVTGTSPLLVASTTVVTNLNADRVDGAHASATAAASTIPIADGLNKLASGWLSEVLALSDLSDVSAKTGTGTTVVMDSTPTIVTPTITSFVNATHNHQAAAGAGQLDHGLALTGLIDDDHTQYALLVGRSGGQILQGGTAASNNLDLESTANITKGTVRSKDPLALKASASTNYLTLTPSADLAVTVTIPAATDTLVNLASTQTISGKTLTSPVINTADTGSSVTMGTGSGSSTLVGKANANTTAVGNIGIGEDDLITYSLPANSLSANGKGVRITAWGTAANNVNVKTVKLYFGTSVLLTTALTVSQVGVWKVDSTVIRTGASAQEAIASLLQGGTTTLIDVEQSAPAQVESGALTIKCTGEATSDNDVIQEGLVVEFLN